MPIVKAWCPECKKDVVLHVGDITVTVDEANLDLSTYTFTCPKCDRVATREAPEEVRRLLGAASGVRWNVVRPPAELQESHDGPPLTLDDLLDFGLAMHCANTAEIMMELEKL